MSVKIMVIDGQADFRSLLLHHVTAHWPEAVITAYDPTAAGHLPDSFSGAGNDIILLGSQQGDRPPLQTLRQFINSRGMPPVVYFGSATERGEAIGLGADEAFSRDDFSHNALMIKLADLMRARQGIASTDSLFVGDFRTGIDPLIKGYRFIDRLSVTGHSAVYLAEKESEHLTVVLKVLRQVPDQTESIWAFDRFLQEYEMIAGLNHPNIVEIYDLGVSDDHAHIAMEYLSGGDLKRAMNEGLSAEDAVAYSTEIASALAKIHSVGILHRDLKPGNIMLRDDGSIALIDFGLAKRMRLHLEITGSGEIFGTPYYMSPEQGHAGDVDGRSDIYSLGVIFYEMLTGKKPYTADNAMGIIYNHIKAPIPLLPQSLARFQAVTNLMLAKKPEDRLQTAEEVCEWLSTL